MKTQTVLVLPMTLVSLRDVYKRQPANYTPALNLYDTQRAIGTVKRLFADTLCATLNLYRVSAPLFLEASTGLNDDLNLSLIHI